RLQRRLTGRPAGALLVLPSESSDELASLHQQDYPFVVVDPALPVDDGIPVVAAANWAGARMATEHLIALGHQRIGIITGPATWCASVDRLAGYHSALLAARFPVRPELVCAGDFTIASGHRAAPHLLALPDVPTPIFALT